MLKFFKYNNRWYADVPNHTLEENEMVSGADQLLSELCTKCGFQDSISLDIDVAPKQPLITLKMIEHDSCGATYSVTSHMKFQLDTKIVWICNVTHDVLGEHPEIIYINRMQGNSSNLNTTMEPKKTKKRNGVLGKGLMVLLIACVLQIPILLVKGLIEDRKELSNNVQTELTSSWGGLLDVSVPELCVPFYVNSTDKDGKVTKEYKVRKIKSSATAVNVHADVEVLHRSIYEVPVYKAAFKMAGTFKTNESVMENVNGKIYVTLPINTYKGLEGYPVLTVDDKEYTFSVVGDELRAVIPEEHVSPNSLIEFALVFKSKGMEKLEFSPLGTDYIVNITSNYASPSFKGDFLPSTRNVTDEGFDAKWEVTALNTCNAYNSSFGVDFIVTADQYQQTERTMKYSFLFVILILSAIFLVESISRSKINVVQYIVTGLSLCLFYLLLLSISEYISFGWAYLIAATMTTGALGGYFYGFLKSKVAGGFTLATGILYAFIYMLLQMESGGLLCGSLALFVILCVIMYFTRKQGMFESRETLE